MDLPHLVNSGDAITAENMNRAFGAIQMLAGFNQNSGVPFSNAVGKKQKCVDIEEFIRRNRPFSIFHKSEQIGNTCFFTFKQYITDGVIRTNLFSEHTLNVGQLTLRTASGCYGEVNYETFRNLYVGFINQRISTDEHRHTELLTEFEIQKLLGRSEVRHIYLVHRYNTFSSEGASMFVVRNEKYEGCKSERHYTYLGEQRLCVDWRYVVNGEKEVCAFQSTETEIYFAQRQDWAENIDLVQYIVKSEVEYTCNTSLALYKHTTVEIISNGGGEEEIYENALYMKSPETFCIHTIVGFYTETTFL